MAVLRMSLMERLYRRQGAECATAELLLDLTCPFELVGSRSKGRAHLFLDVAMSWSDYATFLRRLRAATLIEDDYLKMALNHKATHVPLAWVTSNTGEQRWAPGRYRREVLAWTGERYVVDSRSGGLWLHAKMPTPGPGLHRADLISSCLVDYPDVHGPMLDLNDGAYVEPLSGRLVLNARDHRVAHDLIRRAFTGIGVLRQVEDTPAPSPPRLPGRSDRPGQEPPGLTP